MAWGSPQGRSPFPLNYESISKQLEFKKIQPRIRPHNRDHVLVHGNTIVHRLGPDTVALKLHNTDIVTYYANGDMVLDMGGYEGSQMTRHWVGVGSGIYTYTVRPSAYSPQTLVCSVEGMPQYYDGMRFDRDHRLLSEDKPIMKLLLNAEARALKRQLMKTLKQEYYPHCSMLETQENWRQQARAFMAENTLTTLMEGKFNPDALYYLLYRPYTDDRPHDVAKRAVAQLWCSHIHAHHMFDEVPYQPKG